MSGTERTVTVAHDGQEAKVIYDSARMTSAKRKEVLALVERDIVGAEIAILSTIVLRWEVLDDDGNEMPPTVDVMNELPIDFLTAAVDAVMHDSPGDGSFWLRPPIA